MKVKHILMSILILLAFPLIGYAAHNAGANKQQITTDKKTLYWIDTMEPNVHYDAPGKSRMGMELVPVYSKEKQNSGDSSAKE